MGLLLRRVAQAGVVAMLVATLTFFLVHLAPGDPFTALFERPGVSEETVAGLRARFGLDRPVGEQYLRYIGNALRGDLGYSFTQHQPVADAIRSALPNTLLLMGTAIAGSLVLGVLLGVLQATRRGSALDRGSRALSLFFYSLPDFLLALVLLVVFARWLQLLPAGGVASHLAELHGSWWQLGDRLRHLALPALTLLLLSAAAVARHQRAALLETLPDDYVRTAVAKGVPRRGVVLRHALRNAILPVITLVGLAFPALLGGAVFVERIFAWPGMGNLVASAVQGRDYFLLTGCAFVAGVLVAAGSLLADLLAAVADPRLRDA